MGIFDWKKKKPITGPGELGIKGGEVYVNPSKEQMKDRGAARAARLEGLLKTKPANHPSRPLYEKELKILRLEAEIEKLKGGN